MLRHEYLYEIGIKDKDIMSNGYNLEEDEGRKDRFLKSRQKYGFDDKETWNLDTAFIQWLYERLRMYEDVAIVDLDFHKFDIHGEEKTQRECIEIILDKIEYIIKDDDTWSDNYYKNLKEICYIWGEIIPAMWW